MVQFVAGAAIAAVVIAAANSTKFKRSVNQARRKISAGIEGAKNYVAAIDDCARERAEQNAKQAPKKPRANKSEK